MFTSSVSINRRHHGDGELMVGVVGIGSTVRFVAAARSRAELYGRLAEYVAGAADTQLYPEQAGRVRALLAANSVTAAVDAYFSAVGERWDHEWLEIRTVQLEHGWQRGSWTNSPGNGSGSSSAAIGR